MNELIKLWVSVTKGKEIEEFESDVQKLYDYTMNLQKENQQLKLINKEYERLNKENFRGFKIINVKEYDIDELLSYKKYKNNWNKLKKYINEANEDLYWTNNYDDILYIMQELEQGSDSNENNNI